MIAEQATHLAVFQRTANYSIPARNGPLSMDDQIRIKKAYPETWRKAKTGPNGHPFDQTERTALSVSSEEREELYEKAWEQGGLRFRATFKDVLADPKANETASDFLRRKIQQVVTDPEIAEALTPRDHGFATKRPPIDTHYFETFNRDNVQLVDLKKEPIVEITETGIRTEAGEYPLDIIVFATGFDALTGPLLALDIRGSRELPLREAWEAGPWHLSRPANAGLPEPVHDYRSRQPIGPLQHAGRDRAACRLDHRLHPAHAGERPRPDRGEAGSGRPVGRPCERCRQRDAPADGVELLVSRCQRARQTSGVHAVCGRLRELYRHLRPRRGRGLFRLRAALTGPEVMSSVHPDVAAVLAAGRAAGSKPFEAMTPDEARIVYAGRRELLQHPPEAVAERRDVTIAGRGGPLALRLYRGAGTETGSPLPCLVYLHGGGWVLGNLDSHDGICCTLANAGACWVVAVDYRLAPEHPFPAAIDDSAAALSWVAEQAREIGIDPAKIAVGGDSAGGNLAAVLALMGRDGSVPRSIYQVLLYPVTDIATGPEGYGPATSGMTITPATMRYFIDHYAPNPTDRADWRASPLASASLAGAPAAFVLTCGHDPLRDEGRLYAGRLEREGVTVACLHMSDQTHGMLTMSKVIAATSPTLAFVGTLLRDVWRCSKASMAR